MKTPNSVTKILLALGALALSASAELPKVIRLGQTTGAGGRPVTGGGVWSYVENEGLLEDEFRKDGLKIQWNHFLGAGPARNEAFANNLLDFSQQGDQPLLAGVAGGLKLKVVATAAVRTYNALVVPSDSRIRTVEELRGKRVAVFKGTNNQLAFDRVLEAHGLSEKDLRVVSMNGVAGPAALASKDIDAYFTGSSNALQYQDQGIGRLIYRSDKDQIYATSGYVVTEEFARRYPDAVQRIVNVLVKASAIVSNPANRDKVFKSWAKSGTAYSAFKRDFEGRPLKDIASPALDEYYRAEMKKASVALVRYRLQRNNVDIDALLDSRWVDKALRDQGLLNYWK